MKSEETFELKSYKLYLHLKYSQVNEQAGNSRAAGPQESDLCFFSLKES